MPSDAARAVHPFAPNNGLATLVFMVSVV